MCWTLQGPARRRSASRALRRAAVSLAAVAVVSVLVCSCSTPSASSVTADTGVKISKITPPGLRAQQTVDMLNSDWPIGPNGVGTLAAPERPFKIVYAEVGM